MDEKKLENLQKLLAAFDTERLTSTDFIDAFKKVIEHVKGTQTLTVQHLTAITQAVQEAIENLAKGNEGNFSSLKAEILSSFDAQRTTHDQAHLDALQRLENAISSIKDGKDADEEVIVGKVLAQIPAPTDPDTADDIRNKLELLEGDDRLDKSAIRGLDDLEQKITSATSTSVIGNNPGVILNAGNGDLGRFQKLTFPNATVTTSNTEATVTFTGSSGSSSWGNITGTLSNQTDLQTALDSKLATTATTASVSDSTDKRYVTDAELAVLANTSGTNTGDQSSVTGNAGTATKLATARNINGVAFDGTADITVADSTKVPTTRTVNGHALSANVTVSADDVLPSQTGNSGKLLGTNGTTSSWVSAGGTGDMLAATYDPNSIASDAFAMDNMEQGTTNKYVSAAELTVLGNTSGTNTGDQTITLTGDATGSGTGSFATTVGKINGVALSGLSTGILKNTTTTGIPSIAVASDFPTLNQNTTGSAAKLTTARNIDGQAFDGTAAITVIAPGTHAATSKTTPVDADELPIIDSAASDILKKLTWSNLKATLKTYFDSIYQATGSYITASSTDTLTNKNLTSATNTFPTFNQDTTGSAASFTGSLSGDVTGTQSATVVGKINGVALSGLSTGILKNTTTTGVPSIAVAADFPTLNQNTTGSAATLTTGRTIQANLASTSATTFDGSANITPGITGTLPVNHGGTGATTLTGILKGNGTSAVTAVTAPTGTIVGTSDTQTITNKRNEPRTSSSTSTSTLTPSLSTANIYYLTAQAAALTIAAPTGTPVIGEVLVIYITDNGTSQTLTFNSVFKAYGAALPTATTVSKTLMIVCQYDGTNWATTTAVQQ